MNISYLQEERCVLIFRIKNRKSFFRTQSIRFESNESFDSQSTLDESSEDDRMEVAQTSQERRDILERSMMGGTLSEDDDSSDSQSETSLTDIPYDIPDEMNGVYNFRSKSVNHC